MISRSTRWLIAVSAVVLALPAFAAASWNSSGSSNAYSKADSIPAGSTPSASVSNRSVTVNWAATGGGVPLQGYVVKRYSAGGAQQTIGSNCTGIINGTSCTENSVPPGNWRYSVTPARQNWRGNESAQSPAVAVNAPALSVSPTNVTSLPQTLTGQITNFVPGQTVTFRLDNQATGVILTGSITPSPVPANGTANVSVTLPNGTSNGSHTIYAVGSGPDVASANVTVAVASTITTSAYDWRDASAGGAEANQSQQLAFASDARTVTTGSWPATFGTSRYLDVDLNSPLRGASQVTSGTINMRLASNTSTNACFYVEARKASDNSVVTTYGSSGSPFCTTSGSTQTNFSIPIAATTGALANDLRFRIYGRTNTLGGAWTLDQVSLSVTGGDGNFTLYPNAYSDASTGTAVAVPWSLALDDNSFYNNAATGNWQTAYSATRYLKATFPAYVPTGATVQSVTLTHVYRPLSASRQVCHRVEALNGATVIGTHGSTTSGFSCNSNSTTDLTDSIALPEVDTVAEANSLAVRLHMWRSAAGTTQSRTDQIRLSISYVK